MGDQGGGCCCSWVKRDAEYMSTTTHPSTVSLTDEGCMVTNRCTSWSLRKYGFHECKTALLVIESEATASNMVHESLRGDIRRTSTATSHVRRTIIHRAWKRTTRPHATASIACMSTEFL